MDSYQYAEKLASTLQGQTCYLSRLKYSGKEELNNSLVTLHSLAYKVIKKSNSFQSTDIHDVLAGSDMFDNIKNSMLDTVQYPVSKSDVVNAYYRVRQHQNYGDNLTQTPFGTQLLNNYQAQKNDTLDWEDSIQLATWYLNQDMVDNLYNLPFTNLILVQPQLLGLACNRNCFDFFLAFCRWNSRHIKRNIYCVTEYGEVYFYNSDQPIKLNTNLNSSWFNPAAISF